MDAGTVALTYQSTLFVCASRAAPSSRGHGFRSDARAERFFSGKTRALHATHLSTGDRLWSALPDLRPML